jgi:hypothetical protein
VGEGVADAEVGGEEVETVVPCRDAVLRKLLVQAGSETATHTAAELDGGSEKWLGGRTRNRGGLVGLRPVIVMEITCGMVP